MDCKILKQSPKSWQRGKVTITLEFNLKNIKNLEKLN
ncbi:MAG: hypothetical protein F6K48_33615 [Okeania sp. SIO3H1]|nr:hypothetical protein [Okeania sp. SIO3H1]